MSAVREASISDTPLSVDRLLSVVRDPSVGGLALFVGLVRERDHEQQVASLDYSVHPSAETTLQARAQETAEAFDVVSLAVQHRSGHLVVGDVAVVVAVGAVHRAPALEACRHLIDAIKAGVPIWKEQAFTDGAAEWVGLPGSAG